jgi:Trk K+ transport system NAD-binding subunit
MIGRAIVGGCGHLGSRIALGLRGHGYEVVVIEKDPDEAATVRAKAAGCEIRKGDIRDDDLLEEVGISSAAFFIAATGDDGANLEAAVTARERNEACSVVVRLYDQTLGERVERVFNIRALSASFLASPAFVSAATDDSIVSALTVDGCHLSIHKASARPHRAHGHYVARTASGLGLCSGPDTGDNCTFTSVHGSSRHHSRRPRKKDAKRRSVSRVRPRFSLMSSVQSLAGIWQRSAVITRRLVVTLVVALALSVMVFWRAGGMSPLDAVYFVVTTMTTVGYGDINLQHAPTALKVYGILMMMCGATLLATLYAIVADLVLSARLEYLLGRKGVNLRGHTIVVGLGKVGYRVARDLQSLGVEVVGIESVEDSDNVSSARTMFPVIIDDALRSSILNKAAVEYADTILALTDDPLINLSIALNARDQNPAIRTIARTYDVGLAEKFGSFGIDVAISTSAIAAPAFVDAATHKGVRGSFRLDDEDVLVIAHLVDSDSPFLARTPADIAETLGVAVIATAKDAHAEYQPSDPLAFLGEGQKAIALLTRDGAGKMSGI